MILVKDAFRISVVLGNNHLSDQVRLGVSGIVQTTTALNIKVALVRMGRRFLLVGADPQGSLTLSTGKKNSNRSLVSLTTVMQAVIESLRSQLNRQYIG